MQLKKHLIGPLTEAPVGVLVFFAVPEEVKFFSALAIRGMGGRFKTSFQTCVTGMGRRNAAIVAREAIEFFKPELVITAGFAGGLNPALKCSTVLYEEDFDAGLGDTLSDLGAIAAKFYCHKRVAITVAEKAALWKETGADAVEMESSVIRTICQEYQIPSATVRVISDDAHRDLPLDFNALMTSDDRINYFKLIMAVLARPGRIPKLIEFQRQTMAASRALGRTLSELLRAGVD